MGVKEQILREIDRVPKIYLREILDFICFLEMKAQEGRDILLASESALKKDWLSSEEDEAWKNL